MNALPRREAKVNLALLRRLGGVDGARQRSDQKRGDFFAAFPGGQRFR